MVVGCNIPNEDYRVDVTVICDIEIVWVLKSNPELINIPIIISDKAYEKMKELKIENEFSVLKVFKTQDWHNSAHYAAHYLVEQGATNIDRYGCDSISELASQSLPSITDKFIPKVDSQNAKLILNWNKVWKALMLKYDKISFKVYIY